MTDQETNFVVVGLTEEQKEDLLFSVNATPIDVTSPKIASQQMGDFIIGGLIFAASIITVMAILDWVQAQKGPVTVKLEFFKLFKLEVNKKPEKIFNLELNKKTTKREVEDKAKANGVKLE